MLSSRLPLVLLGIALVPACSAQSSTVSGASSSSSSSSGAAVDAAWEALFAEKTSPPSDLKSLPGLWVGTADNAPVRVRITDTEIRFGMKCGNTAFGISFDYQYRVGSSSGSATPRIIVPSGASASYAKCKLDARVGEGDARVTDGQVRFTVVAVTGTSGYSGSSYLSLTKVAD